MNDAERKLRETLRRMGGTIEAALQGWCRANPRFAEFLYVIGYLLECAGT